MIDSFSPVFGSTSKDPRFIDQLEQALTLVLAQKKREDWFSILQEVAEPSVLIVRDGGIGNIHMKFTAIRVFEDRLRNNDDPEAKQTSKRLLESHLDSKWIEGTSGRRFLTFFYLPTKNGIGARCLRFRRSSGHIFYCNAERIEGKANRLAGIG